MIAPCSVNASGAYLRLPPLFKITNCDLERGSARTSSRVSLNAKSTGTPVCVPLDRLTDGSGLDSIHTRQVACEDVERGPLESVSGERPLADIRLVERLIYAREPAPPTAP